MDFVFSFFNFGYEFKGTQMFQVTFQFRISSCLYPRIYTLYIGLILGDSFLYSKDSPLPKKKSGLLVGGRRSWIEPLSHMLHAIHIDVWLRLSWIKTEKKRPWRHKRQYSARSATGESGRVAKLLLAFFGS